VKEKSKDDTLCVMNKIGVVDSPSALKCVIHLWKQLDDISGESYTYFMEVKTFFTEVSSG
jgi:hypothetical protein